MLSCLTELLLIFSGAIGSESGWLWMMDARVKMSYVILHFVLPTLSGKLSVWFETYLIDLIGKIVTAPAFIPFGGRKRNPNSQDYLGCVILKKYYVPTKIKINTTDTIIV